MQVRILIVVVPFIILSTILGTYLFIQKQEKMQVKPEIKSEVQAPVTPQQPQPQQPPEPRIVAKLTLDQQNILDDIQGDARKAARKTATKLTEFGVSLAEIHKLDPQCFAVVANDDTSRKKCGSKLWGLDDKNNIVIAK